MEVSLNIKQIARTVEHVPEVGRISQVHASGTSSASRNLIDSAVVSIQGGATTYDVVDVPAKTVNLLYREDMKCVSSQQVHCPCEEQFLATVS